jgi:hypothetical protein
VPVGRRDYTAPRADSRLHTALLTALMECVRPEYIPDYDGLVGVWCSLYGEVSCAKRV